MRIPTGYENKKARIELVNLIDIAFVILVFFIYAAISMTLSKGLKVALPAGVADAGSQKRSIRITLAADNTISLDREICDLETCVARTAAAARSGSCAVLIGGDRGADLGAGIELLSRLKEAGIAAVAFEVKKP
ncbi:MAG: biopolymer transporter ExbD [Kiritimatiellia bacterium]